MLSNTEYHKINGLWKRTERGAIMPGQFSTDEFEALWESDHPFRWTEKVDGTNIRIEWWPQARHVYYKGRTDRAELQRNLVPALLEASDKDFASVFPDQEVVFYGEGYGAGIQKGGGLYRDEPGFVLFDVRVNGVFLKRKDIVDVAKKLGYDVVPSFGNWMSLRDAEDVVKNGGLFSAWGTFEMEGLVGVPVGDFRDRLGRRIIVKIKGKDYR